MKMCIGFRMMLVAMLLFGLVDGSHAQGTKGGSVENTIAEKPKGKVYGLITGISRYQDPSTYHTLQYADVDARAFYSFLVSSTGAKADPVNVDTLFNERATKEEFWKDFNSIKNRLKSGDEFYIYFSGHGDAYSSDLAYLLTYNAPSGNDRNNYLTDVGVINVHTLKSLIKIIVANNKANVFLVTDACRSNELPPGKDEGRQFFFEQMYTKNSGEVQLISCLANQVSFEDAKWGGGRGLFSWHLINGLKGMADNRPEDGAVTLKELMTYVSDKVGEDAFDKASKKYLQTPDYCCKEMDGNIMSHVDAAEKQKLAAALQQGSFLPTTSPLLASNKGVNLAVEMKAAGLEEQYKRFSNAMSEGKLTPSKSENAYDLLQNLLAQKISDNLKSDLKFELSSKLMTDVTKVINTYLFASTNNNNYTYDYFNTAAEKLKAFQKISDTDYYSPRDITVNRLFLEGHANWHSSKIYLHMESLRKVDSAIVLKPEAAYLYNLKGLTHVALKQYKEAERTLRAGIALAPNWLYPYHNLARTFTEIKQYDSAFKYFGMALRIDTNYQTTYQGIAGVYYYKGDLDSANYFLQLGLEKDPTDPNIWVELGFNYYYQKKLADALKCFHQGIRYNSKLFYAYEGALMVHLDDFKTQDSVDHYVKKMIACDSSDPSVYKELGSLFQKYDIDTIAVNMLELSLQYDSLNADVWFLAAGAYSKIQMDTVALGCYIIASQLDSTNLAILNQLGNYYFRMNYTDRALETFRKLLAFTPSDAVYYYNYGYIAGYNKDSVTAEEYYRIALAKDAKYFSAYYELAKLNATEGKPEEAMRNLQQAVKYGEYKLDDVDAEPAFTSLKDNKDFKALLLKLKI